MKSTRPLIQVGSDAERLLLAAGADEKPDAASVRRVAMSLGLLPRAVGILAALVIALRTSKASSIAAWGSASLAGVVAVSVVARTLDRPRVVTAAVDAPSSVASPAAPVAGRAVDALVSQPPVTADTALPSAGRASAGARPTLHRPPLSAPGAADTLQEQARALDRIRGLLATGDADGALAGLGEFERRYGGGSLAEEALLLRIEALARRGDRDAAAALAKKFLRMHPASVHVDRVAAWLESLSP